MNLETLILPSPLTTMPVVNLEAHQLLCTLWVALVPITLDQHYCLLNQKPEKVLTSAHPEHLYFEVLLYVIMKKKKGICNKTIA